MLENNNHNQPNCQFSEQLISYLYDEIGAKEKFAFEEHLNSCEHCAVELVGVGQARASILEWRNEEFLPLSIPAIEIPDNQKSEFYQPKPFAKNSTSMFDRLRALLTFSPAFAASLAAIVLCLGLVFLAVKSFNNAETARVELIKSTVKTQTAGNQSGKVAEDSANQNQEVAQLSDSKSGEIVKSNPINEKNNGSEKNSESKSPSRNSAVKISNNSQIIDKATVRRANLPSVKTTNLDNKKPLFAQTKKLPRLNSVEDEEDKSLRLAELFGDEGAR